MASKNIQYSELIKTISKPIRVETCVQVRSCIVHVLVWFFWTDLKYASASVKVNNIKQYKRIKHQLKSFIILYK